MQTKHLFLLLATGCLLVVFGCGGGALDADEAESAIRDQLTRMPLMMGVKVDRLDKVDVLSINGPDEVADDPVLSEKIDATFMAEMEKVGEKKISFVLADLDGTAAFDIANPVKPGYSGKAPLRGQAWFMMTKDKEGRVGAMMLTVPQPEE